MIYLKKLRTRQPQGSVQINWGNPITRGIVGAWVGSSPNVNLVTGEVISTTVSPTTPYIEPNRNGLEYAASIGGSGVELLPANRTPTGQACATLFYRKRDSTNRNSSAFGSSGGAFRSHLPFTDGVVYFDYGGTGGTNRVSASGLTFGNDVWSFNNSPTGLQIWQNGILRASNSGASQTRATGSLRIFGSSNNDADAANTALFLVHDRALTQSEIVLLSNNPWQIFAPSSLAYLSSSEAPPAPTIYEFQSFSRGVGRGIARGIA